MPRRKIALIGGGQIGGTLAHLVALLTALSTLAIALVLALLIGAIAQALLAPDHIGHFFQRLHFGALIALLTLLARS